MGVDTMEEFFAGPAEDGDGAVAAGEEEVGWRCRVVESDLVRLDGLMPGWAGNGGWNGGYSCEDVGLSIPESARNVPILRETLN